MKWRGWLPWIAIAVGAVAVALVVGPDRGTGKPLDPRSSDPNGARGIVDTLRELGVPVRIVRGAPDAEDTAALVLADQMDDSTRTAVARWVEAGGTVVVTDPRSPLTNRLRVAGGIGFLGGVTPELHRNCDLAALRDVETIRPSGGVVFRRGVGVDCFTAGRDAFLVAFDRGRGTVVAVGGASPFLNARLGTADHAALIVDLLAPSSASRVAVLTPPRAGGGRSGLIALVPRRVKLALWQFAIAFLVVVAWRARRLGRPVVESQPVDIAGSELVGAVGQLMQRARGRTQAAGLLRDDVRRQLGDRLGLPSTYPPELLAATAAARTGRPPDELLTILAGPSPTDEAGLVELARTLETLRTEVTSAP